MRFKKSCLVLVWVFLIPLLGSVISKSAASPSLTDRNVKVWSSTALAEPSLVAMSADGRYIVAAEYSVDQYVCLLDANQGVKWKFSVGSFSIAGVPLESPEVTWVDVSDDGSYTAFGGYYTLGGVGYGFVFLFDQSGLKWYKADFLYGGGPAVETDCSGAISGDGSRVAVGYVLTADDNSSLEVYDNTGQFKWGYIVPSDTGGTLASVSMSSDGKYVALGTNYGIYLVHEGDLVWEDHSDTWLWPVRISRDGTHVLGYRLEDNNIVYYDQAGTLVWNQTVDPSVYNYDYDLAISGNGKSAVATGNSTIYFFDQTGLRWTYDTNVVEMNQVKISADGYFIVATGTWGGASESDIFHLNRWGKLIWRIPQTGEHYYVIPGGALAISANGEYFCSTEYSPYINNVDRYFSKKYFNYRFVTPDSVPLPINNLDARWYFSNGTLYDSILTNSSGWTTRMFFDPYFVDYHTEAYYWQTKVGQYTLVTATQYESVSDHAASLFDWTLNIHDVNGNPVTAIVETYLWNGTLYDNRTASSVRFEDLPNQTYTFKAYYPPGILSGQQTIALTQEEQNSTIVIDTQAPTIGNVNSFPLYPMPTDTVKISANVTDDLSGVHNVTLSYRLNSTLEWTNAIMTYNATSKLYEAKIPPQPLGTNVTYMITSYDNTGKQGISESASYLSSYVFDLNGDGKVDMRDVGIAAKAYGARPGSPTWNPIADINKDGKIDMKDIGAVAKHYGDRY